MAKQYGRIVNPFLSTAKQDITAFDDYLWRLSVALDRVQHIGPYRLTLRKSTIDAVLKEREKLASCVQEWLESDLNNGKMAVQLGPLREALYQLEDMADDTEYMRWKQYQANSLLQQLRVVLQLRKIEEQLKDLQVIIKDVEKDFNKSKKSKAMTTDSIMKGSTEKRTHDSDVITEDQYISQGNGCCCRNYPVRQISEAKGSCEISLEIYPSKKFDGHHNIKEQLVERLLKDKQGEELVIPFDVAPATKDVTIPVRDIFHDKNVREQFGLLLHVRASDGPSHQGTLTESILKILNTNVVNVQDALHTKVEEDRPLEEGTSKRSGRDEVKELQKNLSQFLLEQKQKFLLILEDVLEDQLPQLDRLLPALLRGNPGSRIVISSQSSEVLQSVHGVEISNDGNIKCDIFWNFFRSLAFRDANGGEDEEMKLTAKMMAVHLESFPLDAKMIAKMLNTKHEHQFWTAILGKLCHVLNTDCEHHRHLSLLKICYDQLKAPLRLCLQYCSLFPNGWTFTRQNLVQLWMSQGFLEDSNKKLEDVGNRYFDELFSRSFFEKLIDDNDTSLYRLHASVHYFAQVTAGEEFMRLESEIRPEESLCARHLSVKSGYLSALYNVDALYRLRSLIIFGPIKPNDHAILQYILPKLKNARTIHLAGCDVKEFPHLANDLRKHLRLLSIYDTDIDKLPDDFCQYFHLQVLNVQGSQIKKWPPGMTRLCNLRHISGPSFLTSAINHIGRLKDLQELEQFAVSKKHKIKELGRIRNLRGSISITNLERAMFMDATKARLHEKSSLKSLKLEWSDTVIQSSSICGITTQWFKRCMSANVLEHLKPNSDVCTLEINRYIGDKYPSWFTYKVLQKIETIILRNCINLVEAPPLGQLGSLKILKMENLKKLKRFPLNEGLGDPSFEKLIELSFDDMPELEAWADSDKSFPCLELLTIRRCPKLREIPLLESPALREIYVEEVGLKDLPLKINKQVDPSTSSPTQSESLTRLTIQGCSDLLKVGGNNDDARYLPSTLLHLRITACESIDHIGFKAPICLQELQIDGCKRLINPTMNSVIRDLTSVRAVHLDNISLLIPYCTHLVSLEELLIIEGKGDTIDLLDKLPKSSLKKLCLIRCQIESFFTKGDYKGSSKDMENFKSLKYLHLKQCYKMKSLPYLPYNLDELRIEECPLLQRQCSQDGPCWSNISHVPYKYI